MKEALLIFTVVSFLGKLIFNGALGHSYASIKIATFKTLRRLDTQDGRQKVSIPERKVSLSFWQSGSAGKGGGI